MRKVMRVFVSVVLVSGLSASAMAGVRGERVQKGGALSIHLASATPHAGYRKATTAGGELLYVMPRATYTSLDVVSVDTLPGRNGETISMRLSGNASRRLADRANGDSSPRVAIYAGGELITSATINIDGSLTIGELSPERASRITRGVESAPAIPAGPVVTVVNAGTANGTQYVDVYVQGVDALRSYQLKLITGGGDSGTMALTDVTIDRSRADFLFADAEVITANNARAKQLAAVGYDGASPAQQATYLGTFAFVPTPDASGTFRVNVELGSDSLLADGENKMMRFSVGPDARIFLGNTKIHEEK